MVGETWSVHDVSPRRAPDVMVDDGTETAPSDNADITDQFAQVFDAVVQDYDVAVMHCLQLLGFLAATVFNALPACDCNIYRTSDKMAFIHRSDQSRRS